MAKSSKSSKSSTSKSKGKTRASKAAARSTKKKTTKKKAVSKKTISKKKPASKKVTKKKATKTTKKAAASKKKAASKKSSPKNAGGKAKPVKKKATAKKSTTKKTTKTTKKKAAVKKAPAKKKSSTKKASTKTTTKKTAAKASAASVKKAPKAKVPVKKKVPYKPLNPALGRGAASVAGPLVNGSRNGDLSLEELSEPQLRRAKSGLKKKDLDFFRGELLKRRAEILGDVQGLDPAKNSFGGEISNMPLHMADVGSENYEREFNLELLEFEKKQLREINEALLRIVQKTYGVCHVTGLPIERARLEAKPSAKYSIEIVRERERRGLST